MRLIIAIAILLGPSGVLAQTYPPPTPSEEMGELKKLVGRWGISEVHEPSVFTKGGNGKGTATVRLGPGGHSILMDSRILTGPAANVNTHAIYTWHAADRIYKALWVYSLLAGAYMATGSPVGSEIVLVRPSEFAGKAATFREVFSDRTPKSFARTVYVSIGGEPIKKILTQRYTRR